MHPDPLTYEVRTSERAFERLTAAEALETAQDLIAHGKEPFLYDRFGDPMSLADLEMVVVPKGHRGEKRIVNAIGLGVLIALASAFAGLQFGFFGLLVVMSFGMAFAHSIWRQLYAQER